MPRIHRLELRKKRENIEAAIMPCKGAVASSRTMHAPLQELIGDRPTEAIVVVHLDTKNKWIGYELVALAHNHPSGDPQPSQEDNAMTERLREAGKLLAVPVLDHIIIGDGSYFSYRDSTAYLDA